MKVDRLETHDRLLEFKKQADQISQGCQDCIAKRPEEFGSRPFYIFAHKREIGLDERASLFSSGQFATFKEIPTHRMIWQSRLKKPSAQVNSMLFKYYPSEDVIKVIWIIPEPALWDEYTQGKLCENSTVSESIFFFKSDKKKLEADEPDDLSDEEAAKIGAEIGRNARNRRSACQLIV